MIIIFNSLRLENKMAAIYRLLSHFFEWEFWSSLVQLIVWHQTGDKPLPKLMLIRYLMPHGMTRPQWVKSVISKHILEMDIWVFPMKLPLKWILQGLDQVVSALVQVMAWCLQATSHCLNQCWPSSVIPFDVTRGQWVNLKFNNLSETAQTGGYMTVWWCTDNSCCLKCERDITPDLVHGAYAVSCYIGLRLTHCGLVMSGSTLVRVMACHLNGAKPLSEPMLVYCWLDP